MAKKGVDIFGNQDLSSIFQVVCCFCVFTVDVLCGSWIVEVIQTYVSCS